MIVPAFYFAIGGRQRPGVVPAIPGHLVIIISIQLYQWKPPRGINFIKTIQNEKHHTAFQYSVVFLVEGIG